ncbi:hypothetical protein [Pontibacter korlensis]|nr:hypothetical protein [Pontibacter korlensis]
MASQLVAQDPLLVNVYNRKTTSLNGAWHYINAGGSILPLVYFQKIL